MINQDYRESSVTSQNITNSASLFLNLPETIYIATASP